MIWNQNHGSARMYAGFPVLNRLSSGRVFHVVKLEGGGFGIMEACDDWYAVELTKEEVLALSDELKRFVEL